MPTILGIFIESVLPKLIALGIQEGPILVAFVQSLAKIKDASRPDITDEERAIIRDVIVELQRRIDAL